MKYNPFLSFFNVALTARRIKDDPYERERSVRFGVTSIIMSILMVALVFGASFLIKLIADGNSDAMLLLLFVIGGIAVCAGGAIMCLVGSLIRLIWQLVFNRKAIGWIALVVFIAAVAGSAWLLLGLNL